LTNATIVLGTHTEAYNPSTNEYKFLFYNDGLYPVIDPVEVELPYDHIPDKAETVEIINGNILAVGGITEGKDRPSLENVELGVTYYDANLSNNVGSGGAFQVYRIHEYSS